MGRLLTFKEGAQGVANAQQALADIREWEQLPATVWLGTGRQKTAGVSRDMMPSVRFHPFTLGGSGPLQPFRMDAFS